MKKLLKRLHSEWSARTTVELLIAGGLAVVLGWLIIKALLVTTPIIIIGVVVGLTIALYISRRPYWGVILIGFFLPFERIGSLDFGSITIRISQLLALIAMGSWFARGIIRKKLVVVRNPVFWSILIFVGLAALSLLNAPNFDRSLTVLLFTVFTIVVAVFLPNVLTSENRMKAMLKAIFIGMGVTTVFGLFQFLGDLAGLPTSITGLRDLYTKNILGFPRIQSTALEPLYFANYLLLPISLLLTLQLKKLSPFSQKVTLILLLLAGLNFVLTVSRGGYIAAAISIVFIAVFTFRQFLTIKNITMISAVVVLVGLLTVQFLQAEQALDKFITHAQNVFSGASYNERVETYELAYRSVLEHPLLGIGMGSFGPYASYHPYAVPGQGFRIVNNEYLELATENGLLGLAAFVLIIAIVFIRSIKAYQVTTSPYMKAVLLGLCAALLGIMVQYNTFSILYIMHVWVTIGLLMAAQQLVLNRHE